MRIRGLWRVRRVLRQAEDYWIYSRHEPRCLVLMYHRITDGPPSVCGTIVRPENFEDHLDVISSIGQPLSLEECVAGLRGGAIPDRGIVLTFDDGYTDNLTLAAPILARWGIPATVYIAGTGCPTEREYWWDRLEALCLDSPALPAVLSIRVTGTIHRWSGAWGGARTKYREWRVGEDVPNIPRLRLYRALYRLLLRVPADLHEEVLGQLAAQIGPISPADGTSRLTGPQITTLANIEGIGIGAHTASHVPLDALPPRQVRAEVLENRTALEAHVGEPIQTFAYPFGLYDWRTVHDVRELGFQSACTSDEGVVWRRSDPFRIPRVTVLDEGADAFRARLQRLLLGNRPAPA